MALLSVNINKIATLRNSRGQDSPNLSQVASDLLSLGVRGITVHPRPDERHVKRSDVFELTKLINDYNSHSPQFLVEFNIEGYPSREFLDLVEEVRPDQCTLVPDPPEVLTSNAGWKMQQNEAFLIQVVSRLKVLKVRSSLFVDPQSFSKDEVHALAKIMPDRIELYTEAYAKAFSTPKVEKVLNLYASCAKTASELSVGVNAGHDLNQGNLKTFIDHVPETLEVSIGHALICEALYEGFEKTIGNYHQILRY